MASACKSRVKKEANEEEAWPCTEGVALLTKVTNTSHVFATLHFFWIWAGSGLWPRPPLAQEQAYTWLSGRGHTAHSLHF